MGIKIKAPTPNTALKNAPPDPRPPWWENSANMTPAISPRMAWTMPDTFAKDNGLNLLTIMSGLSVRTLQRLSGPDAQMASVLPARRAMRSDLRQVGSLRV